MRFSTLAFVSMLAFATTGRADTKPGKRLAAAQAAVPADAQKVTMTNEMVGKAKTWLPADVKLSAGKPVAITLVNTLPDAHGFSAPGLTTAPIVVGPKETKTIVINDPKPGTYKFLCQLHPKHVGGTIEVK